MNAELVMIGTELLLGEITDTNATKLAQWLRAIGLDLYYKTTVGDNFDRIVSVLNLALERADVVITSGGMGPTVDDLTRQAVAEATGRPLIYSTELEAQIAARFRSFGREMTDNNRRQAYLPEGATVIINPVGTAPCFLSEDVRGRGAIISLPGVPRELTHLMENSVLPMLVERMGGAQVLQTLTLRTCAVGESRIDSLIGDLMELSNPKVGLAAHLGQVDVRVTAKAATEEAAAALIAPMEQNIRQRLGVAIFGTVEDHLPAVVGQLLTDNGLKLGLVDTLTGGKVAEALQAAGFEAAISRHLVTPNLPEAIADLDVSTTANPAQLAAELAQAVTPPDGIGLALIGPLSDGSITNATFIALNGPGDLHRLKQGRSYGHEDDYTLPWLVVQGLDLVRRAVLGQLESPAD